MNHVRSVRVQRQNLPLRRHSWIFDVLNAIKLLPVLTWTKRPFINIRKSKQVQMGARLYQFELGEAVMNLWCNALQRGSEQDCGRRRVSRRPVMLQILFPSHGEAEIANCLVCYWNWPEFYGAEGRTKICKNKQTEATNLQNPKSKARCTSTARFGKTVESLSLPHLPS